MTLTRDSRGTGVFTLRCDSCGRTQRAADGMLAAEVAARASGHGWRITAKRDTCPPCTKRADSAAKTAARKR